MMPDPQSAPPIPSLLVLDRDECLELLASVPLGQVVYSHRALPEILPVNFRLDRDGIVIRVASGSTLARVADGTVLAFHADRIDEVTHSGWSVTVVGRVSEVVQESEQLRIAALPLESWAGNGRDHFLRIAAERVTGRKLPGRAAESPGRS